MVLGLIHRVVADAAQLQLVHRALAAVKEARANRAQEPLVAASGQEVDRPDRQIEAENTKPLDHIQVEQDLFLLTDRAQSLQVEAEAVGELDAALGHDPRS